MKNLRPTALPRRHAAILKIILLLALLAAFGQTAFAKAVGTVKSITGNSVVLTTEGGEVTVTLTNSTRILRASPGQTDLKSATPIQASEIHVGDRMLAIGPTGEGNSVAASTVVVMTQSDIAQRQQQEREEWRKGVGGIVKEVNPAAGTIAVVNALVSSGKPIIVHVSPTTSVRRYSPDSVNFDEAKPGTLDQIKTGDQLRARGTKNEDGSEFTAQAIVSGTFRNIAGTVISTDAANNSITVMDLLTKHPVTLKISADSQMHKLPPVAAQRLAARLKGGAAAANGNPPGASGESSPTGAGAGPGNDQARGQGNWRGPNGSGGPPAGPQGGEGYRRGGGSPDFQQLLSRMPSLTISDLQKGDAVMVVATEGSAASAPTAITLISGVEPIFTAAPSGAAAATILSPWNLGASPGGEASGE
ncbi:MAG TPA: hypothetical protein VN517_07435 [Terriglobales bacterium]|jgi:hypothetical protein|nr:hypothetical protein [Terriglobales bacterium]